MEIVAALFVEGIDFRQVEGPATRIDITGAFFSTAVAVVSRRSSTPHLVVLVRAPAGTDGNATLETVFVARRRRGDRAQPPDVLRRARQVRIPPGEGRARVPRAGHDRGALHDRRERLGGHGAAHRAPARLKRDPRSTRPRLGVDPGENGSREPLRGRALAASHAGRGGRRGRGRDHRAVRRRAPRPASSASRRRTTSGAFEDVVGGLRKLLEPEVFDRLHGGRRRGRRRRGRGRPGLSVFAARFGAGRVDGDRARRRCRPTTAIEISGWPDELPARGTLLMLADPYSFPIGRLPRACATRGCPSSP